MKGKVVAVLETRTGEHLGELIARRGGIPLLAPALDEIPIIEPDAVSGLLHRWRSRPYRTVIFQTGVGTRALFHVADALDLVGDLRALLLPAVVVVRGPKPVGELNSRQIRIDIRAPSPFTTETMLEAMGDLDFTDAAVLVQSYGARNEPLKAALESRGAVVDDIATYRWALPKDLRPLESLLEALAQSRVDAVVFTSAIQVENLFAVADIRGAGRPLVEQLNSLLVASVGPVCSRALRARGISVGFEADPPKLGPLVSGLDAALQGVQR